MPRALSEIDRLIEEGLALYGRGDLDGALLAWEQVLIVDPEHAQAASYVDYVRMNYELLMSEVSGHGEAPPFAIADDEEEYEILISPGQLAPASAVAKHGNPADEGWAIAEERGFAPPTQGRELTVELEADEPSDGLESYEVENEVPGAFDASFGPAPELAAPSPVLASSESSGGISFDDATREYPNGPARPPSELLRPGTAPEFQREATPTPGFDGDGETTPGFGSAADLQTPLGFGSQQTDIRRRDLGFVQPVEPAAEHRRARSSAPELKMTLRTPSPSQAPAPAEQLDAEPPTIERSPIAGPSTRDLPGSSRKPAPTAELPAVAPTSTRDFPPPPVQVRPPAMASDFASRSDTRDFEVPTEKKQLTRPPPSVVTFEPPPSSSAPTRDFAELTTAKVPKRQLDAVAAAPPAAAVPAPPKLPAKPPTRPPQLDPLISAPTRDLGLRQSQPGAQLPDEEATGQAELRNLQRTTTVLGGPDGTRNDVVLPFDPIDARSAQILDEIDEGGPTTEAREDRTRRRITALFERASEWCKTGDVDRAVAAIDLALSEDPNSALAQKLIHRNRDTMMAVFQTFLGDLQRTPALARPLHELGTAPISPRAAFLLSRVDGQLSIDEILDVSGMPRLEAYRYLCQLFLRGILR